jgi:7-cyano-7-deazaguanine synthase
MLLVDPADLARTNRRAVLLFSGGFDSTLVALFLKEHGVQTIALSVEYPGRPLTEKAISNELSKDLGFQHCRNVPLGVGDIRGYSEHVAEESKFEEGWFPHRNSIFFGLAAHIARVEHCDVIASGIRAGDARQFDDSTIEYLSAAIALMRFSGAVTFSTPLYLFAPLLDDRHLIGRDQLLSRCRVILDKTWSFWREGPMPCGCCLKCLERPGIFARIDAMLSKTE